MIFPFFPIIPSHTPHKALYYVKKSFQVMLLLIAK